MVLHRDRLWTGDQCADSPVAVTRPGGSPDGDKGRRQDSALETAAARNLANRLTGRKVPGMDEGVYRTSMGIAVVDNRTDTAFEVVADAATRWPLCFPPRKPSRILPGAEDLELEQEHIDIGPPVEPAKDLNALDPGSS